jgi:hypothetical protein
MQGVAKSYMSEPVHFREHQNVGILELNFSTLKFKVAKKKISSDDPSSSFIEVPVKKQNHFSGENINIIFPNGVKAILNKEIAASRLIEILQALGS